MYGRRVAGPVSSEWMEPDEADLEKARIESEWARLGDSPGLIQIGTKASVQSRDIYAIRTEDQSLPSFFFGPEGEEPRFRRDMTF
jgi:hypothetical protein